jgi:AraC-like DNA-binding protein
MHAGVNTPANAVPPMHFSTDDWPESQRRSAATDFCANLFKQDITPLPDRPFLMRGTGRQLPGLRFMSVTTLGLSSRRRPEHVASDDVGFGINLEGTRILTHRGRDFVIRSGDALISNDAEPGVVTIPEFSRYISLRIPAHTLPRAATERSHLCQSVPRDNAVLRLLRTYAPVLADETLSGTTAQALAVGHIRDLVATILCPPREAAEIAEQHGVRAARLKAIKDDIARNIACEDLSVGAIALRHQVTPRYIAMLFESEGVTFTEYVLDQRLARAHCVLSAPRQSREKVSAIALDAGFGDLSYFYRVFRRRYGVSPSDVRAQARLDH